ncbi:glycosyltransferase family 4 protein [Pseudomonas viridiflava]|uniref:glycosyltransferase family 4 protein n=1 Tax=Pseudomonas viridiflava TaxID=33069 RepID=UPI000F048F78|nr:glycosyltransferase family 4 protein [Pseudomonas viridiflava]
MKVAMIGTSAAYVLNFRSSLITDLVAENHAVYVFAVDYCTRTREEVSRLGGVPIDYSFSRSGLNPLSDFVNTLKLSGQIKKIAPDVVFAYCTKPVIFGAFAATLAGVKKRIGMLEGLGYAFTYDPRGRGLRKALVRQTQLLLYRLSLPLLGRVVFLNADDPKDLLQKHNLRVRNLSVLGAIGLDLKAYGYSKPPTEPVGFIFIGRLLAEKGVHEYVEAARLVKLRYPLANFVMLGGLDEGNPSGLSAERLADLVAKGVVVYPGHVENVSEWLGRSSVFVLPSYREGFPRSTQEAMAIGRPVITTDTPGCRETVVEGKNGFLIPPWCASVLAEKMIYFIEHPEQIEVMGLESYAMARERFDMHKVNGRLIEYLV